MFGHNTAVAQMVDEGCGVSMGGDWCLKKWRPAEGGRNEEKGMVDWCTAGYLAWVDYVAGELAVGERESDPAGIQGSRELRHREGATLTTR